ncbi:hypothetical protein MTR_1g015240 [Medicago truncatula]|uniref:Uncharacterized protein n=1 Tax=Medicago truncatula TaxID=3880 RepID=G7I8Z8_MEDTR|nr:hypothetical protein MTR_1g015240 [Medicago truncatula]
MYVTSSLWFEKLCANVNQQRSKIAAREDNKERGYYWKWRQVKNIVVRQLTMQ